MWTTLGEVLGLSPSCRQHTDQFVSASVSTQIGCGVCLEENKVCECQPNSVDGTTKYALQLDQGGGGGESETETDAEENSEANSSVTHAVINMVGMLIGLGQLSTPYAVENGGWASSFLLVGLGVICAYSSLLLGKCLDRNHKSRSYTDIGGHAFGRKGRFVAAAFIYMEIFMALVSYTISLHDNLSTIFIGTHLNMKWSKMTTPQFLTVVAVFLALPSLWLRNLSVISFLSSGGILMSFLIFVAVASTAVFGVVKANHNIPVFELHNIPSISGLYIFSYAGHIVFPNLHKSMKDPRKFTKVTIVSFTLVTSLYTILALLGAKLFGADVNPQITLSMPRHFIMTKVALWATVLTPMTKYALEFAPFAIQLEHNILPSSMSERSKMIIRGSVGSALLLIILALALSVPYFQHVLSLTGSLVSVAICVVLPCAFYTKICWGQTRRPILVINISLIVFGFFLGILGTYSSSKLLLEHFEGSHQSRTPHA